MSIWRRVWTAVLSLALVLYCGVINFEADDDPNGTVNEVIRDGFYRFSESIDISAFSIKPEELSDIISKIIKDDPYLFFVNGQMSYSYKPSGYVISLKPSYSFVGEAAFSAWELCRINVRELAEKAKKYSSHSAKALFIHDEICRRYEYDVSLVNDSMYGFFLTGKGTCQAYTQFYMAVLRECGIEAHYVASDTIEHIWNYVNINGEWYHADLTWDDSASSDGNISRRHFLCSDTVAIERGHRDWYSSVDVECSSDAFKNADFDLMLHNVFESGDADHNGKADLPDLLMIRRYIDFGEGVSCLSCADIDLDGSVSEADAGLLRKKLLGMD